ncbi:MAG: ABC transporter substrate-binding protein [Corynebacterium sp.]|nr:ABC transporter substrate-binding protein [Corynebacterium sp.]
MSSDQDAEASVVGEAPVSNSPRDDYARLSIGVDSLGTTFNPHINEGDTHVTRIIAALTLPSAFVDGNLNTDLLLSAAIVPTEDSQVRDVSGGQTVRYVINPSAQWSDSSPITGSDFSFLWQQMTQSPNVINAAGYFLIDKISTSTDGRTVDVHFTQAYTEWNTLFDNLLPSHALRSTSAFSEMLRSSIPASAGRYHLTKVSPLGVATLIRNDRYWGEFPALAEEVTFREVRMPGQMGEMLARQNLDAINTNPLAKAETKIASASNSIQSEVISTDRTLNIIFNQNSTLLTSTAQRARVANLIDFNNLYSNVIDPVYQTDLPTRPSIPAAESYVEGSRPIRVAANPDDALALAVAESMVSSFRISGVNAELVGETDEELATADLPNGSVDILVDWQRVPTNVSDLASRYSCNSAFDTGDSSSRSQDSSSNTTVFRRDNLSGFCNVTIQADINATLSGAMTYEQLAQEIESSIESTVVSYPVVKEMRIQAIGSSLVAPESEAGHRLSHWQTRPGIGIFGSLPSWTSISRENEE